MNKISLSVKETAELLGISETTVYRLVRTNEIPHSKIKGKILFHRTTLEDWFIKGINNTEKVSDLHDSGKY